MVTATTNGFAVISGLPRLTDKQGIILTYICEYFGKHRCVPKHRDLCDQINVSSANAGPYFKALLKKGYLAKENDMYQPTSKALEWLDNEGKSQILQNLTTTKNGQMSLMIAS
jgi:predicted transcriptional regulator